MRHVVCVDGKLHGTITLAELEAELTLGSQPQIAAIGVRPVHS